MQFTKLRLLGFKSFVDPTELVIAPGITGVVGPNGCGKSNLLEALRWVMGENRPTAMRGGGMEDVIFAGSESRPARNFAEVTLHIDNTARLAPAAFNHSDSIEIIRRITRDAGSAYKVNGAESRARDVQMLFADASTGAHSPALVRQGQISELINAKPKSRRRVLEEAAGISGLYKRRHEAELKLNGTEANLARVEDVLDQLDHQLKSLARQARQAARYREIADELRRSEGLLLYRRWREADIERHAAAIGLKNATNAAASAQSTALAAARQRDVSETKVPPLREEEAIAAAVLQRLVVEQAALADQQSRALRTIDELQDRLVQLARDKERETGLNKDAGETIKQLDWEADALAKASTGHEQKLETTRDAAREAAQDLQGFETEMDQLAEDAARLAARHQSANRRLEEARNQVQKITTALDETDKAVAAISQKLETADSDLSDAKSARAKAIAQAARAETATEQAEQARTQAQTQEAESRVAFSGVSGEAKALEAETTGLRRLIERDQKGKKQILDSIKVQKGYEAALGAALADDLKAPEIDGNGVSGWVHLPEIPPKPLPKEAARLADYVTAPDALARRLLMVGVVEGTKGAALQGALTQGQRLVSRQGDLWRWDGYRAGAQDTPSAAALRLQQMNRLAELEQAFELAAQKAANAEADHINARDAMQAAQSDDQAARAARRNADEAVTLAARHLSRAEADREMLSGQLETANLTAVRQALDASQANETLKEAELGAKNLGDVEAARSAVEAKKIGVEAARLTMMTKRSIADDLRREGEARVRRAKDIGSEKVNWQRRLDNAKTQLDTLQNRLEGAEADLKIARTAPQDIAARRDEMQKAADKAEARRKAAADALAKGETALRNAEQAARDAERSASDAREARARADAVHEAAVILVDVAADRVLDETGVTPMALLETLEADPDKMPDAELIENDVSRLKRQRDALGAVNLRAEEDSREVAQEFDTLHSEKTDLEAAVKKLRLGIANLNSEGRERLLKAFDEVNKNFNMLFKHLFGGGDANLVLVESDDPLEAGLELMCQPPGKKLATMSLLSGGEQTLTAMSLIFAVFLANPSPICVLDEVDAPLDDANVTRFCDLLDEMAKQTDTRFLIITHHAVTMSRMDRLFGVTMAEKGVSQLVSVDLRRAEEIVEG